MLSEDRDTGGRGVIEDSSTASDRFISPQQEPIQVRGVGNALVYDRFESETRDSIAPRDNGRAIIENYTPPANIDNPQSPTPTVTASQPFGQTLASYFSPSGGGGGARAYDTPISVVAGDSGSGGSNTGLILLVLVVGGGAAYWYYKKGGFNA